MSNTTELGPQSQCNLNRFPIKPLYTIEYADLYKIPLEFNIVYFYNPFTRNTIIRRSESNTESLDKFLPVNNESFLKDKKFVIKIIKEYENISSANAVAGVNSDIISPKAPSIARWEPSPADPRLINLFRKNGWYILFNRISTTHLVHDNIYTAPFYINDKNNAIVENPPMLSLNGICDSCEDEYNPFTWDTKLIGLRYIQNGKII